MRPKKEAKERKNKSITIYVEPWLADYIESQARTLGQDKSGMVREWVIKEVRKQMTEARAKFREQPDSRYNTS
jgi:hypothetical protein